MCLFRVTCKTCGMIMAGVIARSRTVRTDVRALRANFRFAAFLWAPLCQAALLERAREYATKLLKAAFATRLFKHRNASLRDLPQQYSCGGRLRPEPPPALARGDHV